MWADLAAVAQGQGNDAAAREAARAALALGPPRETREFLAERGLDEPGDIPESEREIFEAFSKRMNDLAAEYGAQYALAVTRGVLRGDSDPAKQLVEAKLLLKCGRPEEALQVQERLEILWAPLDEHEALRIDQLARTKLLLGQVQDALVTVCDRPDELEAEASLLQTEALLRAALRDARASQAIDRAVEALREQPRLLATFALELARYAEPERAATLVPELIEQAVARAPEDGIVWGVAGAAWRMLGEPERELEARRREAALGPPGPAPFLAAARVARQLGQTEVERELLAEAVDSYPEDAPTLRTWASLVFERAEAAEAEPFARRATERAPRDSQAWLLHGKILHALGRDDEAADSIAQALWWPPLPDVPPELAQLVVDRYGREEQGEPA